MNWLDILILIIVIVIAVRGSSLGLIKSIIGFVSFVVAFFTANIFYDNLAIIITNNTKIVSSITSFFELNVFSKLTIPTIQVPEISASVPKLNDQLNLLLENSNFINTSISNNFGEFMARITINSASWILIFICVIFAVKLIGIALEGIFKLPGLKTMNFLGGFLLGLLKGLLLVFIIVLGLNFIGSISEGTYLVEIINNSYLANIILKYKIF